MRLGHFIALVIVLLVQIVLFVMCSNCWRPSFGLVLTCTLLPLAGYVLAFYRLSAFKHMTGFLHIFVTLAMSGFVWWAAGFFLVPVLAWPYLTWRWRGRSGVSRTPSS